MRSADVRVRPALEPGESYVDPKFVLVETALDERGDPVTTIEHCETRIIGGKLHWHVATIGQAVPLSHAAALEWTVSFAASRDIPVVYERDETVAASQAAAPSSADASASSAAK